MYLYHNSNDHKQNGSLVTGQLAEPPMYRTFLSPEKSDPKITNEQNQATNIDITKPIDQSPWQRQFVSSAKPVNPPASDQPPTISYNPTATSQQQGTYSGPPNAPASQQSQVTSGPTHPERSHTSRSVPLGMFVE